jgi:hypothetical protein
LLNKSEGRHTPLMLRKGRTALVSYLIKIKSPGWIDVQLTPSSVPSYLGYLSPSEDYLSSRKWKKKE